MIVLITDAAPSAKSSTSREVQDFVDICNLNSTPISVIYPSKNNEDIYMGVEYSITCQPIFYKSNNLIFRLISEVLMALMLSIKILVKGTFRTNISKIIYISPSIFNIVPALLLKKITRVDIYLILRDMFPFWLVDIGKLNSKSITFKLLKMIADLQMSASNYIGVESKSSLNVFLKKYPMYESKTEILWNWITTKKVKDIVVKESMPIRVVYAGSLGEAQGIDHFIALIQYWKNRADIEIHILGRGVGIKKLINYAVAHNIKNFYINDQVELNEFDDFLSNFNIGLLFLNYDLKSSNIPGKFMSYVMNGLPVLGAVNPGNDLISFVRLNELGYLDSSGSENNFLDSADNMIREYKANKFSRKNIQNSSVEYFSTQKAYEKIICKK